MSAPGAEVSVVAFGLGSAERGDDALGGCVVRAFSARVPSVRAIDRVGDPVDLIELWRGVSLALVCDAVTSGRAPGHLHRIDATAEELPAELHCASSHALGLAAVVEMARALDRLPRRLVVYGVEAARFERGAALSVQVAARIPEVVSRMQRDVELWQAEGAACTSTR